MSFTRGTTQIHAFIENAPHGSIKPLTVFAGSREALLISDKKRSAVRLGSDKFRAHRYRLAPNAGSLEHWDREDFSFDVFVMYTSDIKAQTRSFVNRLRVKMYTYIHHEMSFHFVKQ